MRKIKSFSRVTPSELQRFHDEESFKLKHRMKCLVSYLLFGVIVTFFVLSTLAVLGIINNPQLADAFFQAVLILVGGAVGFGLGSFYEKSK